MKRQKNICRDWKKLRTEDEKSDGAVIEVNDISMILVPQ